MARALRIIYPGACYHVTSRGNERKEIFKSRRDREKFLEYLASATDRYGTVIYAYCLMDNHFHLFLATPAGNLSQIMRHIIGAYTTYFNIKRKRSGHLFQGRYKSVLVESGEYAAELTRYLHLNPVKAGIVGKPEEFQWSSYRSYTGEVSTPEWLKAGFVLSTFGDDDTTARKNYRDFVEKVDVEMYESPLKQAVAGSILGSPDFVEEITTSHFKERGVDKSFSEECPYSVRKSLDEIITAARKVFPDNEKLARQGGMYLCHNYSGATLKEIAGKFAVGVTAIGEASKRFAKKMAEDESVRDQVAIVNKWIMES